MEIERKGKVNDENENEELTQRERTDYHGTLNYTTTNETTLH